MSAPGLRELPAMRELSGLHEVSAMHEASVRGGYADNRDVSGVGVPEGKCGGQGAASSMQRASRRRWSPSRRSTGFWEGRALFCKISSTALMVSMLLLSSDMLCSLK